MMLANSIYTYIEKAINTATPHMASHKYTQSL